MIVKADRLAEQIEGRAENECPGQIGVVVEGGAVFVKAPFGHRGLGIVLDVGIAPLQ